MAQWQNPLFAFTSMKIGHFDRRDIKNVLCTIFSDVQNAFKMNIMTSQHI